MSLLDYGSIQFSSVRTIGFAKKPVVSNRGNYMHTEIELTIEAVYNAAEMAYRHVGQNAQASPGAAPAVTEDALRHLASLPRQELHYRDDDGNTILRSPRLTQDVDPIGGPFPTLHSIEAIEGHASWQVVWSVKTAEIRTDQFSSRSNVALEEHEWKTTHTIDDRGFMVDVTEGRATFHEGILDDLDLAPDDFREMLIPLPYDGFKRMSIEVTAEESGRELQYRVLDQEQRCSLLQPGVQRIECFHTAEIYHPAVYDVRFNAATGLLSSIGHVVQSGAQMTAFGGQRRDIRRYIVGHLLDAPAALMGFVRGNTDRLSITITVRTYGSPGASMATLRNVAWMAMRYRWGNPQLTASAQFAFSTNFKEESNLHDGVFTLIGTFIESVATSNIPITNSLGIPNLDFALNIEFNNIAPNVAEWRTLPAVEDASVPRRSGVRGSRLSIALAQAIRDAADRPATMASRTRSRRTPPADPQA